MRSTCKPSDSDIDPPKYTDRLIAAIAPFWPRAEVLREFDRPRDDLLLRDNFVDRSVGERLRGRERLALEDRNQGAVRADQARQSLGAAAAWIDSEEHFRVTDEELAVSHDA